MKRRIGVIIAVVIGIASALAVASRGKAPAVEQVSQGAPQLIAASFTSAWCSSCRILEPRLAKVMPAFKDSAVEFIDFDFTFGETDELAALAAAHSLTRLYEANKGATGFTVLLDAGSGEIIDTLTMNFTTDDIERAIARALDIASRTDDHAKVAPVAR